MFRILTSQLFRTGCRNALPNDAIEASFRAELRW